MSFNSYYGVGTSPAILKDKIIIFSDSPDNSYLVAIDVNTGSISWREELVSSGKVYGSSRTPLVKSFNGIDLIFIWHYNYLRAFNLQDGKELANINLEGKAPDLVSSLISDEANLYLADPEFCRSVNIERFINNKNPINWEIQVKGPNIPTPILVNDLLFVLNDRGRVYCINPVTGNIIWKADLPGQTYFSSPISNGKLIYFTDNDGLTTIIEATDSFKIVSENKLECSIHASMVPYKDNLLIRSFEHLYCISAKE